MANRNENTGFFDTPSPREVIRQEVGKAVRNTQSLFAGQPQGPQGQLGAQVGGAIASGLRRAGLFKSPQQEKAEKMELWGKRSAELAKEAKISAAENPVAFSDFAIKAALEMGDMGLAVKASERKQVMLANQAATAKLQAEAGLTVAKTGTEFSKQQFMLDKIRVADDRNALLAQLNKAKDIKSRDKRKMINIIEKFEGRVESAKAAATKAGKDPEAAAAQVNFTVPERRILDELSRVDAIGRIISVGSQGGAAAGVPGVNLSDRPSDVDFDFSTTP